MSKPRQSLEAILALASTRAFAAMTNLLGRPENRALCGEAMVRLEQMGDQSLDARCPTDALNLYAAALSCGMVLIYAPNLIADPASLGPVIALLQEKVQKARGQMEAEQRSDAAGPSSWEAGIERFIDLGRMGRFTEANNWMDMLDARDDRTGAACAECGRKLESIAGALPATERETAIWFYEESLTRFEWADSSDGSTSADFVRVSQKLSALAPPALRPRRARLAEPLPEVDFEELILRIDHLAEQENAEGWVELIRDKRNEPLLDRIARRFEELGDAARARKGWTPAITLYRVASAARALVDHRDDHITQKVAQVQMSIVDEALAQAGHADEVGEILRRLGFPGAGQFETVGDHLYESRPDLARWFYREFDKFVKTLPADTALEGYQRANLQQSARHKLEKVEARLRELRA